MIYHVKLTTRPEVGVGCSPQAAKRALLSILDDAGHQLHHLSYALIVSSHGLEPAWAFASVIKLIPKTEKQSLACGKL